MQSGVVKRRRLNDSSSTLSKPFKSPLRKQPGSSTVAANSDQETDEIASTSPSRGAGGTDKAQSDEHHPSTTLGNDVSKQNWRTGRSTHNSDVAPAASASSPATAAAAASSLASLRKQESALLSRLVSLRRDLDTVSQALRIEQTDQDAGLERLVVKWKTVSRDAAEELFAGARDKVNRMGGVEVWREKMRSAKMRRVQGWEDNEAADNDRDEDDDEDVAAEKERRRKELQDEVGHGEADQEGKNGNGGGSEGEDADVCICRSYPVICCVLRISTSCCFLWSSKGLRSLTLTDFYYGHDAQKPKYRSRCDWIRQGQSAVD